MDKKTTELEGVETTPEMDAEMRDGKGIEDDE